jgi:hypothetical protein
VTGARSEKAEKRRLNRALRTRTRTVLRKEADLEVAPHPRELKDVWDMAKDGKYFLKNPRPRDLRK